MRSARLVVVAALWMLGCPAEDDETSGATDGDASSFCARGTPVLADDGEPSGYEDCEAGPVHRVEAVACRIDPDMPGGCPESPTDSSSCLEDADCVEPGEKCRPSDDEPLVSCSCEAVPRCESDADCDADQACFCDGLGSRCVPADCRTDADCPGGSLCALFRVTQVCQSEFRSLTCVNAADECRSSADCQDDAEICRPQDDGGWSCELFSPAPCG